METLPSQANAIASDRIDDLSSPDALQDDHEAQREPEERLPHDQKKPRSVRSIWISDVHLGTRDCQAKLLDDFLKSHQCQRLYIVGDFIDGWKMRKHVYWKPAFTRVIRRILKLSKKGVNVIYITGNHDEFLRKYANQRFEKIHLKNRTTHIGANGKRYLVLHGDLFDGVTRAHQLLKWVGDWGYEFLMWVNRIHNAMRARYGLGYWSLAGFLKKRIKRAQTYIEDYERSAAHYAEKLGYDGIICGHIHQAAIKTIGQTEYCNTGDWVESCTALLESFDGHIELVSWADKVVAKEKSKKKKSKKKKNKKTETIA